jgi:type II secretory pathway pseudopilin PulG
MKTSSVAPGRSQRGFGILEIAVGLVVVASIAAGAMLLFQRVQTDAKVEASLSSVAQVESAVRSRYLNRATYEGVTEAVIASSGLLPSKMVEGGNRILHPFNRELHVQSWPPYTMFNIRLIFVTSAACTKLVTQDLGKTVYSLDAGSVTVYGRAMTPAEAETACAATRPHVRWRFK